MISTSQRELAKGKLLIDHPAEGVLRLTLSYPEKRNALDDEILGGISRALDDLSEDPGAVRCLMITGSHGMFSAGYEIGEITDGEFPESKAERLIAHPFTEAIEALESFPYPTLAAMPGHTIGGGLELALACDLRVARAGIKLGMPPAKLGLVYSHTGLRRFIDTIGAPRTRELFLLGSYIDADVGLAWGLVNRVTEPEELESVALAMASLLASNAPLAQAGNKRVIGTLLAARGALPDATEHELIELRSQCFTSDDLREGMRAFAEKRPPRWRGT
jgi:enoyl-CoA hydratase/carnithine racemase